MTIVRDFAENIQSDGDLIISGDLQVSGTTTTVNSTTVEIGDKNIVLGANATANSQNDGGGISILLPDPSPDEFATFTHTGTTWNLSDALSIDSGNLNIVSGNFQIGGTTVIDGSQNATFAGTINSGAITSTGKISATQGGNFNTNTGSYPFQISRGGSATSQVLNIGILDTQAVFNYIEDTSTEGAGNYGSYLFQVSGDSSPTGPVNVLALGETAATFYEDITATRSGNTTQTALRLVGGAYGFDLKKSAQNADWAHFKPINSGQAAVLRLMPKTDDNDAYLELWNSDFEADTVNYSRGMFFYNTSNNLIIQTEAQGTSTAGNIILRTNTTPALTLDTSQNATFAGTISSVGQVLVDANGTGNTLHIWDDSTTGQPGLIATDTGSQPTSTQTFYAKQYGTGLTAQVFGESIGGRGIILTDGTASTGLLIGTYTNDNIIIGTNNTAALTIDGSQISTFSGINNIQRDVRSAGQVRANGWYNASATTNYTGLAFEIGVSSGKAFALSYNRDTSSYGSMEFNANDFEFNNSVTITGNRVLTVADEGSGNGLDADTVDGIQAASFLRADANTATTGYLRAEGFTGAGGSGLRMSHPAGASFSTQTSSVTGAIKITLPVSWTSTMLRMTIKVYEYDTSESFEIVCGGYNYSPTSQWINTFAYILGDPAVDRNFDVFFGHDGSKCAIYIGATTSTWSYPQVFVTDFEAGFQSFAEDTWNDGWSISFVTSLGTITSSQTSKMVGSYTRSLGVGTPASGTIGEIRATNNITAYYSDERLKNLEGSIDNALEKVQQLTGYYFTENEKAKELGYDNSRRQVGVSAQEVEKVLPEVVTSAPIDEEYKSVWYDKLVPLLIEAVKELKQEVEELKRK